jgi:hypothetical protein
VSRNFSVGWTITGREHSAIAILREQDWSVAVDTDGKPRPVNEANAVARPVRAVVPIAISADRPTAALPLTPLAIPRRDRPGRPGDSSSPRRPAILAIPSCCSIRSSWGRDAGVPVARSPCAAR